MSEITDLKSEGPQSSRGMIRFPFCCCFSRENPDNERQPLLGSRCSEQNGAESARRTRSAHIDGQTVKQSGQLVMRRVGVPELDQRFMDVADTFNEQQHRYETTVQLLSTLQQRYGCSQCGALALSEVLGKIRDEHAAKYRISLKINGYDFSLCVVPVRSESENAEPEPLPPHLQIVKDEFKSVSQSAKATISKGTALQELIGWLLRSRDHMAEQVKGAAVTYQEQGRLVENLEGNIKEVVRAKEWSMEYRQKAGKIFIEAADLAGPSL